MIVADDVFIFLLFCSGDLQLEGFERVAQDKLMAPSRGEKGENKKMKIFLKLLDQLLADLKQSAPRIRPVPDGKGRGKGGGGVVTK